jgi:hypothetical protein
MNFFARVGEGLVVSGAALAALTKETAKAAHGKNFNNPRREGLAVFMIYLLLMPPS